MNSPVAVIGLGCIGGSLACALSEHGAESRGWSASPDDNALARTAGIDVADSLESAVSDAGTIVIAVPVQAIAEVAGAVLSCAAADAEVVHCGGVQSRESLRMGESAFARIFGAHPLAGSHDSGFAAAKSSLFLGSAVSIESRAPEPVRSRMEWMWTLVGAARLEYRAAAAHDAMMAWISHLPQLASTALAATLAGEHVDPCAVGPGARDTTRLAASSFEQWSSLLRAQPALLDRALEQLERNVSRIRSALVRDDDAELRSLWDSAREWRRNVERDVERDA